MASIPAWADRPAVRRFLGFALTLAVAGGLAAGGAFERMNQWGQDVRFRLGTQSASQDIVFLEIDGAAIDRVGVWPWPRSVYARIIEDALNLGAQDVWLDIDFSAPSTPEQDALFEAGLDLASGYTYLAAFTRPPSDGGGPVLPLERFARFAAPFAVNVTADRQGIVRDIPFAIAGTERPVHSLAVHLARPTAPARSATAIDYGISAQSVPAYSLTDLLSGALDPDALAGRHVVVGASAVELQDEFFTPNQGVLPGAMLQILAAETELAQRHISYLSWHWAFGLLIAAAAIAATMRSRTRNVFLLVSALAVEAGAIVLYLDAGIMVPTAVFHVTAAALALAGLLSDTRVLGRAMARLRGERDTLGSILKNVVADSYDGIVVSDINGCIVTASQSATAFFDQHLPGHMIAGILPDEIMGAVSAVLADSGHAPRRDGRARIETPAGNRDIEYVVTRSAPANCPAVVSFTFRDITVRLAQERRLDFLAHRDPVTKLYSRSGLLAYLSGSGDGRLLAGILMLEVERFDTVTATLGHEASDALLRLFAERLIALYGAEIGHLGNGQFVIPLPEGENPDGSFARAQATAAKPLLPLGHRIKINVRGGYALPDAGLDPQSHLHRAEISLIAARERAAPALTHYDDDYARRLETNRQTENELTEALDRKEFVLFYQPQVDIATGTVIGAEALVRWQKGQTIVGPDAFLPVAEQTGFIVELTRWVLYEACRTAAGWPGPTRVAVNVSVLHFELGDLVGDVETALAETGLDPARLEIEITESDALCIREDVITALDTLRARGVKVAIDDFGTGYSSLAYLDRLPADVLKIDKCFIDRIGQGADTGVLTGIVAIARSLGKTVVAEGIETEEQLVFLRQLGCDVGQGYYFAKPRPQVELIWDAA